MMIPTFLPEGRIYFHFVLGFLKQTVVHREGLHPKPQTPNIKPQHPYLEVQSTYSPNTNRTYNPTRTILGHLRGLLSGYPKT